MSKYDAAGRQIAGLLGYNPGPGIYSRLERAVQQMPENVRVQELPGLLKRYKDGVPGWELKATNLDEIIAGRDVVPREELLARVREASPVYTHREVVLGGRPPTDPVPNPLRPGEQWDMPSYQEEASAIGRGIAHGDQKYADYGQGGEDYTELLLVQPGARANEYGNHWLRAATFNTDAAEDAVAHARFDTHGDALRINELQSDLGIHNRKMREQAAQAAEALRERGAPLGALSQPNDLPFPLEDAWADLLIKRLALEAARQGHRAIEVASPRAIADKVGGNIENYEHFYGKVVPGALERLGRKMGGLVEDTSTPKTMQDFADEAWRADPDGYAARQAFDRILELETDLNNRFPRNRPYGRRGIGETASHVVMDAPWDPSITMEEATHLRDVLWGDLELAGHSFDDAERIANQRIGEVLYDVQRMKEMSHAQNQVRNRVERAAARRYEASQNSTPAPGRRYLMSDEMRRRIIEQGIGAALMAPIATEPVNGQAR